MTALCTCPHCQSEYHAYEYPLIDDNGKQHMIRKGFCPECGITLSEVPSDWDEVYYYRMQTEAQALRYALGHDLRQFLEVYQLCEYPFFTFVDMAGNEHRSFTQEEAQYMGYAYYPEGWTFHIKRNKREVAEIQVPKGMDRYILSMSYSIDGTRIKSRFGCPDQATIDRLILLNRMRPIDDFTSTVI